MKTWQDVFANPEELARFEAMSPEEQDAYAKREGLTTEDGGEFPKDVPTDMLMLVFRNPMFPDEHGRRYYSRGLKGMVAAEIIGRSEGVAYGRVVHEQLRKYAREWRAWLRAHPHDEP